MLMSAVALCPWPRKGATAFTVTCGASSARPMPASSVCSSRRRASMITKFGTLFAGHVDLDDMGLDGTPVNARWLSAQHLASVFDKAQAIAQLMDRTGFDTFWLA